MTFRISKYTYNSWKTPARDKNKSFVDKHHMALSKWSILFLTAIMINTYLGVGFYKQLVRENRLVQQKFEDRKRKQLAFDYMIFSQSRKESDKNVDGLSLV